MLSVTKKIPDHTYQMTENFTQISVQMVSTPVYVVGTRIFQMQIRVPFLESCLSYKFYAFAVSSACAGT